jgi:plastocyanin
VKEVLEKYEGRVAWVYRHMPYQPGGKEAAVASECIAELAGEDAFWEYTQRAFDNTRDLSPEWHLSTAKELGVDESGFTTCIASGKYDALIAEHTMNGQELGANGTPYNVLLTKKGDTVNIVFTSKEGFHDWVVDDFDVQTKQIFKGQTSEVSFVADKAGTFEYYCSVGNHRAQGMVGTLIVE